MARPFNSVRDLPFHSSLGPNGLQRPSSDFGIVSVYVELVRIFHEVETFVLTFSHAAFQATELHTVSVETDVALQVIC